MIKYDPKKYGYGDFGNLASLYECSRRGFPPEVLQFVWSRFYKLAARILDIGCGTGISTRQLVDRGADVIGVDKDPDMLSVAMDQEPDRPGISYVTAPADRLPFDDGYFDGVTAFSAFHWFTDRASVSEIERVLRRRGWFFVVNKDDADDFKIGYRALLKRFIQDEIPDAKERYDPFKLLTECGFLEIEGKFFEGQELFTLSEARTYLQSISLWNLVPQSERSTALEILQNYCKSRLSGGFVRRRLRIVAVAARRPDVH